MKDIHFEGVTFSREFLEGFKNEEEFLKEMDKPTYREKFEGEGRAAKLKELYALSRPKKEVEKKGG